MPVTLNGTNGLTFNDGTTQATAAKVGMVNRIINGDMRIDQRNAGASGTALGYMVDRWFYDATQSGKVTWQQNAGSVTPPAGFTNYLGLTVGAAANVTVGASDTFYISQIIEGYNVADLGWGAAGAVTVTVSFWVRSSLTGTFSGSLANSAYNRSYPFTYTISAANTWEQKTVTITGDTTGTWLTTNGSGLRLIFSIGAGSTYSGTAGAWAAAGARNATGAINLIATNSATFYITGVQLEAGTVASPFERRDYGRELIMCQRYAIQLISTTNEWIATGFANSGTNAFATIQLPVVMRSTSQTLTVSSASHFNALNGAANTVTATALTLDRASTRSPNIGITVASGLTSGQGSALYASNASASLVISAEL